MDGASALVLEGRTDALPSLNVSDSATVDGTLVLRISLPPTFSSWGVWQNYTIMNCEQQCHGVFRSVSLELAGSCFAIKDHEHSNLDNALRIAILFQHLETCFAAAFVPPVYVIVLLLNLYHQ